MRNAERGEGARLDGSDLRIAIVQARFNAELTDALARGCRAELVALGVAAGDITHLSVPGALEIGVALNALADADEHDALIAIGCVIRGETYHFELVANESASAVTRVAIDHGLAIANAILTCDTIEQAAARVDEKGRDAARVAVEMANLLDEILVSGGDEVEAKPRPARPSARRSTAKSARRRSRELALQGLYEWLLGGADAGVVDAHVREQDGFDKCDTAHFDLLLHGVIREAAAIDAVLAAHIDRKAELLSPIEHAALMIGTFELMHCVEIPYRVAINEAVELAKSFGGTDGHKYVNGVLDKAAAALRPSEVAAVRAPRD